MVELSIVMPIYNGENFLHRSICSVLNQSYKDYELVLIDDGSTDKSVDICNYYKNNYENVLFISLEKNTNSFKKKMCIVEKYIGQYMMVIDQDDYLEKNMASKMMEEITKSGSDIVVCNWFINENGSPKKRLENKYYNHEKAMEELIRDNELKAYLWNKIYKKDTFYRGLHESTDETEIFGDFCYMPRIFHYAHNVKTISDSLYHYSVNSSSFSSATKKAILHYNLANSYWIRIDFLAKEYPMLLKKTPILNIAFENSLGAWRELFIDTNFSKAKKIRLKLKEHSELLKETTIPKLKKIIIKCLILF